MSIRVSEDHKSDTRRNAQTHTTEVSRTSSVEECEEVYTYATRSALDYDGWLTGQRQTGCSEAAEGVEVAVGEHCGKASGKPSRGDRRNVG